MNTIESVSAPKSGKTNASDVIEIGLLLPQTWATALLELSHRRQQSVAQLLRSMIDHELRDEMLRP